MTSKNKIDAVELAKLSSISDEWITKSEALELIQAVMGCSLEEAIQIHDQFKRDMPDGWKEVSLN